MHKNYIAPYSDTKWQFETECIKVKTMEIKPIKTEADYNAAQKNIEQLWDASYGSSEGDKLDVLTTLVEVYENEHYPIPPPDPIDAILHYMESQGLTEHDIEM